MGRLIWCGVADTNLGLCQVVPCIIYGHICTGNIFKHEELRAGGRAVSRAGKQLNKTTEFLQTEPTALGALAPKDTNKIAEANNSKSPQRSQTCHTQTFVV